ncbi:TetR/AcrR family transcriptional regulator [Nocardioides sp. TRM66260-LWL]|uniref:TetR/AcrR family transcriptional regulator n=1 Tax=Nocardioides sp. TRM66260-LWL TaxID=2874478 RepID=UPI001CC4054C|nr:TetR/AcrR family transcriptional regulator [Nocardioides sp. TRM66260-LWL]MBZ5736168.1 TetR/AcrR family transcriptional regulator [Nocardioides sp. TRM66260-LWL]
MSDTGRTDRRRTDGRAVVLRAARSCMAERGYHGTSIRDIAARAGMTSAALYHHFASKQAVLAALMDGALAQASTMVDEALAGAASDPPARLQATVHAWALFHAVHRDDALIGSSELRSLEGAHLDHVVATREGIERRLADVVLAGVDAGDFRTADALLAARAVMSMGSSIVAWFDPSGPLSPEEIAETYAGLALGAVQAERVTATPT